MTLDSRLQYRLMTLRNAAWLLTDRLTALCSTVIDKLLVPQPVKFSALWNLEVHHRVHNSPPLVIQSDETSQRLFILFL